MKLIASFPIFIRIILESKDIKRKLSEWISPLGGWQEWSFTVAGYILFVVSSSRGCNGYQKKNQGWIFSFIFSMLSVDSYIQIPAMKGSLWMWLTLWSIYNMEAPGTILKFLFKSQFPFKSTNVYWAPSVLKIVFIYFQRQGNGGRKRGRETSMCGCLSCALHCGPGLQPRHVPWLGMELVTLLFVPIWRSIHWATPARAWAPFSLKEFCNVWWAMQRGSSWFSMKLWLWGSSQSLARNWQEHWQFFNS